MRREEIKNLLSATATLQYTVINTDKGIYNLQQQMGKLGIKKRYKQNKFEKPEKGSLIFGTFTGFFSGVVSNFVVTGYGLVILLLLCILQIILITLSFLNDIFGGVGYGDPKYVWANFLPKIFFYLSWPVRYVVNELGWNLPIGELSYKHLDFGIELITDFFQYGVWIIIEICIILLIVCLLVCVLGAIVEKISYSDRKKQYERNLLNEQRKEQEFYKRDKKRLDEENIKKIEIERKVQILQKQRKKAESILAEIKSLNIIPVDYFKLEIVCILYKYFQNGNVDSMKEAINKYDLESRLGRIETKLDNIIQDQKYILEEIEEANSLIANTYKKQQEILDSNHKIIAQNNRMIDQSQEKIEYSRQALKEQRYMSYNLEALNIRQICQRNY